jgi:SAM-dependent methyltransferase
VIYEAVNQQVLLRVPREARRVLDLGCGSGALGAALKEAAPREVVGVTYSSAEADAARARLDDVRVADLNAFSPARSERFDCVLCSHVLEHLWDPAGLLTRLRPALEGGGLLVAALPNALHWRQRLAFLRGRFEYTDGGVMDRTHLRFFDWCTARALFEGAGYEVLDAAAARARARPHLAGAPAWPVRGAVPLHLPARAVTLVTVGIPTHARPAYLKEAVEAALAQSHRDIEVLISDDGNLEEIRAIGEARAAADRRVRYQRNARNLGLAGNWNAVADAARGEYLVIIGDDDRLLPTFVERMLTAIGDADVAFSNHFLIDAAGCRLEEKSLRWTSDYGRAELPAGPLADPASVVWRNAVPMSAALVRTAVVRRLRFKEDLNTPEIELFARLAQEGGRFTFVPEYLMEFRDHAQSATAGGLRSERLVKYLEPLEVAPEVEPQKRRYMEGLLVDAVGRALQLGDVGLARELLRSRYYPGARLTLKSASQRLCAAAPVGGPRLYRALLRLKRLAARPRSR